MDVTTSSQWFIGEMCVWVLWSVRVRLKPPSGGSPSVPYGGKDCAQTVPFGAGSPGTSFLPGRKTLSDLCPPLVVVYAVRNGVHHTCDQADTDMWH